MYNYWRSNKNVILTAVALFIVSLTALLYFLTGMPDNTDLKANVVDSLSVKSQIEQEKSYRSLLGEHDGPLVAIGIDGLVLFSSWDFESMTGYRLEDIKDQLFYSLIHPDDLPMFIGGLGKVLSSESPLTMIGPYRIRNIEGTYRLNMVSLYPVEEEEKITMVIIAIRDITDGIEPESKEEALPISTQVRRAPAKAPVAPASDLVAPDPDPNPDPNRGHGNEQNNACDGENAGVGGPCGSNQQDLTREQKEEIIRQRKRERSGDWIAKKLVLFVTGDALFSRAHHLLAGKF